MDHSAKSWSWLSQYPFFVPGIIVFFITHGYSRYVGLVPFSELLIYFFVCISITGVCFFIINIFLRSYQRTGIYTALFLVFYLFFREIYEMLGGDFLFGRHSLIIITLLFISGAFLLFRYLYRSRLRFLRITAYLNVLLFILVHVRSWQYRI